MKIQPINSNQNFTSFQKRKVNITQNLKPQEHLTVREELNKGYTRGIIAGIIMIIASITFAIVREHNKRNEAEKQQIEVVQEPDATLRNEVYLDNIKD